MTGGTRDRGSLLRRERQLEYLTIGWNALEAVVPSGQGSPPAASPSSASESAHVLQPS